MRHFGFIGALLLTGSLAACSSTPPPLAETPETVVPYWIDGVCFCSSRMIDKNLYWIEKFKQGKAKPDDLVEVLRSNNRFYQGLIGRMDAHKYCAALARQERLAQQKKED